MTMIKIIDDPLYQLLRDEKLEDFNKQLKSLERPPSFAYCDFRGLNLRGLEADGLDFSNAYFRGADLRGIDFRNAKLDGASIADAKVSGCFFPADICAEEVRLSIEHGTRMRSNAKR